jgi:hypothetical protein
MLTEKHVEECSLFVTAKTWRETIMSFTYWMDFFFFNLIYFWHTYNGMLSAIKRKWSADTCYHMAGPSTLSTC